MSPPPPPIGFDSNQLFEAGALFLLFDVPPNTEFGIDYNCWQTGEKFKGVKMIPPGVHFVYFRATSAKNNEAGLRQGFFHDFKLQEVVARKWNPATESIELTHSYSDEQLQSIRENKRELDMYLGAYPFESYKKWRSLTSQMSDWQFLSRILPESGLVSSGASLIPNEFKSSVSENKEERECKEELFRVPENLREAEKRLPQMKAEASSLIRFTTLPSSSSTSTPSPAEVTQNAIDQTNRLEQIISKIGSGSNSFLNVLAEMQLAFVCFLVGHVYDAFAQWKRLLALLCNCDRAVHSRPSDYVKFVDCVYFQVLEMPEDFLIDLEDLKSPSCSTKEPNFLCVNLHNFFDNASDVDNEELKRKCLEFKNFLQQRFAFDFETEPDEYAPVIVDL